MPNTIQDFFATATQKAATDLTDAYLSLPEDKRDWKPAPKARTATDQVAECAMLTGYTADLIQTQQWAMTDFRAFVKDKEELKAQGWDHLKSLLDTNVQRIVSVIQAVPDDALSDEIALPMGKRTVAEIISYPYWNMSYHLGQITYISTLLEDGK